MADAVYLDQWNATNSELTQRIAREDERTAKLHQNLPERGGGYHGWNPVRRIIQIWKDSQFTTFCHMAAPVLIDANAERQRLEEKAHEHVLMPIGQRFPLSSRVGQEILHLADRINARDSLVDLKVSVTTLSTESQSLETKLDSIRSTSGDQGVYEVYSAFKGAFMQVSRNVQSLTLGGLGTEIPNMDAAIALSSRKRTIAAARIMLASSQKRIMRHEKMMTQEIQQHQRAVQALILDEIRQIQEGPDKHPAWDKLATTLASYAPDRLFDRKGCAAYLDAEARAAHQRLAASSAVVAHQASITGP